MQITVANMKVAGLLEAVRGLDRENEFRPKLALKLGRIERKLLEQGVTIDKVQQRIMASHRVEDPEGNIKTVGRTELESKLTELMEDTVELSVETITLNQLEKGTGKKKDLKAKGTWLGALEEVGILIVEESDADDADDE